MNISSAQPTYSITSSDVITLDLSSITTTLDTSSFGAITLNSTGAGSTYTIGGGGGGAGYTTIYNGGSISPLTTADIQINFPAEWENRFPDWDRIQKMCEEYPGLKIAFEKFKTTYLLVKDDYDAPPHKKIRP